MSILRVIGRELRAQARQSLTFLLRLVAGAAIGVAFGLAFWALGYFGGHRMELPAVVQSQNFGMALFGKLNLTIFSAIWIFTPLAAADAISRERREGTLPLLRLTELRPWEIVLGKSFVHMLRSSSLFLTMTPWLLVPILFGGVGPRDLSMALLIDSASMLLAGSAGLIASTFSRDWIKTTIWAEALALILLLFMLSSYQNGLVNALVKGATPVPPGSGYYGNSVNQRSDFWTYQFGLAQRGASIEKNIRLINLATSGSVIANNFYWRGFGRRGAQSTWQELWSALTPYGVMLWFASAIRLLVYGVASFILAVWLGSLYVERSWRDRSESALMERWRKKYLTPRYGIVRLRRNLSRSLNRNPIGWLHHYSPSARMTKWGWCLFVILLEVFLSFDVKNLYTAQWGLGIFLVLGLLFSSVGSFRNELETGAFELLLVTPIRERQIVFGRVRGIWHQFALAFIIYGAGFVFLTSGWSASDVDEGRWTLLGVCALLILTAPVIGLYFSLLRWNFLAAWVCACFIACITPFLIAYLFKGDTNLLISIQLLIAGGFAWRTSARLMNRLALTARG
jgi:ABC-type transport system involved in multi-copper enzyme maturation permease subunit